MTPDPTNLKEIREMLQSLDIHYGWVSKTPKLAGRGVTHLVNGDLDEATTKISKMIEKAYDNGYVLGFEESAAIANKFKGNQR